MYSNITHFSLWKVPQSGNIFRTALFGFSGDENPMTMKKQSKAERSSRMKLHVVPIERAGAEGERTKEPTPFEWMGPLKNIRSTVGIFQERINDCATRQVEGLYRFDHPSWFRKSMANPGWGAEQIHSAAQAVKTSVHMMQEHMRPALEEYNQCAISESALYHLNVEKKWEGAQVLGAICARHVYDLEGALICKEKITEDFQKACNRDSRTVQTQSLRKDACGLER